MAGWIVSTCLGRRLETLCLYRLCTQPCLQLVPWLLVNCKPFQGRDVIATSGNQDAARMARPEGEQPLAVNRIAQLPNPHCHPCL